MDRAQGIFEVLLISRRVAFRNLWHLVGGERPISVHVPLLSVSLVVSALMLSEAMMLVAIFVVASLYALLSVKLITASILVDGDYIEFSSLAGLRSIDISIARSGRLSDVSGGMKYSQLLLGATRFYLQPLCLLTQRQWRELLQSDGDNGSWSGDEGLLGVWRSALSTRTSKSNGPEQR